jgi:hypothetical protein
LLWSSFIDAKRDQFCKLAIKHYQGEKFRAALVRGGPLDMAEYRFLKEISKRGVFVAHSDGRIFRLHTNYRDDWLGLFSRHGPYESNDWANFPDLNEGQNETIKRIGGRAFKAWTFGPRDDCAWTEAYGKVEDLELELLLKMKRHLWYHSLPICFERERFIVVEELPFWLTCRENNRDQVYLVKHFAGWSLCVADNTVGDWETYIGDTDYAPDGIEAANDDTTVTIGRPAKVPRVAEIFTSLYPNGRNEPWKLVLRKISEELGEPVSKQTVNRAIDVINEAENSNK